SGAEGLRLGALVPLVLASGSPRRAEILRAVGWPFEAAAPEVDETRREGEPPEDYVRRLAREKAEAVARTRLFGLVLGADTTVVVDGEILEKPRDAEDARRMLRRLGGRWHEVLTGVALVRAETGRAVTGLERTRVRFAETSEEEVNWHVETGDVLDKAGAYAIQGRAALFIEAIDGDYWNVVGLPVRLVYELARGLEAK
ncbi:MAG TPA: nucleoside triphosphate pyrophosphatase, partial [Pyrinomonadaceae bacterium]|nr:nucleoside triphosphate pyrophosphatase [Pyrinomonadaceae bacterium]